MPLCLLLTLALTASDSGLTLTRFNNTALAGPGTAAVVSSLESLADCDLVVEAIIEDIAIKQDFYGRLGAIAKPSAIFGSNTSSLLLSDMAPASGRADKFVGLHFFNPVQLMRLMIFRAPSGSARTE